MYELYFSSNFFQNFLVSTFFLFTTTMFTFCITKENKFKKILVFDRLNFFVVFYLIFFFYYLIFSLLLLINLVFLTKYIVYLFLILKFLYLILRKSKINFSKKLFSKKNYLFFFITICFFLISILPITDADSIAYHLNSVLSIFKNGPRPIDIVKNPEFSLLSGSEILLVFSAIFNSNNFGAQLNCVTLIILIFSFIDKENLFPFFIVSCPLIVFLISTQKLQLFYSILFLVIFILVFDKKIKTYISIFILSFLIAFYTSGKLTNIIISFPIIIFYLFLNQKKIFSKIFLLCIAFLITFVPILILKYKLFLNPFSPFLTSIFPYNADFFLSFTNSLRTTEGWIFDSPLKKILVTFVPLSINDFTKTLGLCFLLFLLDKKILIKLKFIPVIIMLLFYLTGQTLPRYFFESFLILSFYNSNNFKILKIISLIQYLAISGCLLIFIYLAYFKHNVMIKPQSYLSKYAYSYHNLETIKKMKLQGNILLTNQGRASIFDNKNIYSSRYMTITNLYDEKQQYEDFLKKYKIKYVVSEKSPKISKCFDVYEHSSYQSFQPYRNFLRETNLTTFYIYRIIPKCK